MSFCRHLSRLLWFEEDSSAKIHIRTSTRLWLSAIRPSKVAKESNFSMQTRFRISYAAGYGCVMAVTATDKILWYKFQVISLGCVVKLPWQRQGFGMSEQMRPKRRGSKYFRL